MGSKKKQKYTLELVKEEKIYNLLTEWDESDRLEASGVLFQDSYFYVIFDNLSKIAKIASDISRSDDNKLLSCNRVNDYGGFEDITSNHYQQIFYVSIEALPHEDGGYKAKIQEYDCEFNRCIESNWVDFTFESENKGFEGLQYVYQDGNEYLLALCEGNRCKGGKKGRKPGGGRIQVLQKAADHWKKIETIKIPKAVQFEDYSALSIMDNRVAVVSQASSKLWLGKFRDSGWDFVDDGKIYQFPKNEQGKTIYCNVEGVSWIYSNKIVVVSDKRKSGEQSKRCRQKDQSIHIFNIPGHEN
ncbi:MAG: hypothetical protein AB4426_28580 [Xenococcaceae cyanobacterium]